MAYGWIMLRSVSKIKIYRLKNASKNTKSQNCLIALYRPPKKLTYETPLTTHFTDYRLHSTPKLPLFYLL